MANSLLTISMITREAVRLWKNSNAFLQSIDTQYDNSFGEAGAKIGSQLRIRLPNDYTVRTGPAAQIQDTAEQSTVLTMATQKGVDMSFSTAEMYLSIDDFSERFIAPAINNLAGDVAQDILNGSNAGICNAVANFDGSGNVLNPVAQTYLQAKATLMVNSAPSKEFKTMNDPITEANVVASLAGLFNPQSTVSKQYMSGEMFHALGSDWFSDQLVIKHTTGTLAAGAATINGANQTGLSIVVSGLSGSLTKGDIITIAGVFQVNRITKTSTGTLRQFVVTADVAANATIVPIYPALVPSQAGQTVQYQTVTVSPTSGAAVTPYFKPSVTYRRNFTFAPEAVTMATADLMLPRGTHEAARAQLDGVSMRMISDYDVKSDQMITRLDVLYGYLYVRPEWATIVADAV